MHSLHSSTAACVPAASATFTTMIVSDADAMRRAAITGATHHSCAIFQLNRLTNIIASTIVTVSLYSHMSGKRLASFLASFLGKD